MKQETFRNKKSSFRSKFLKNQETDAPGRKKPGHIRLSNKIVQSNQGLIHQYLGFKIFLRANRQGDEAENRCHEGDEVYTRVRKNAPPDESIGWTVVLMDRASRFIWELRCGRKDRKLFKKALGTLERLVNQTQNLSLIMDGERRYGNVLFDICHEVIRNGKKGRPRKTLKKGVKVRVKNKGSQSHKRGPKRSKYQAPHPEHPDTVQDLKNGDIHANHCEAFNSSLRRRNSTFRRRTNTYAKSGTGLQRTLDVYWVVHNFLRSHFTTKQVPAVYLGILDKALSWKELLALPMAA